MKLLKNKIIVFLLILSFSLVSVFNVPVYGHADQITVGVQQYYFNNLLKIFADTVGVIFNGNDSSGPNQHSMSSHLSKKLEENGDDRTVDDFLNDNLTINGDNISIGRDLVVYMNDFANDYINSHGFRYVYSYDIKKCYGQFANYAVYFKELGRICQEYQDNYYIQLMDLPNPRYDKNQFGYYRNVVLVPNNESVKSPNGYYYPYLLYSSRYKPSNNVEYFGCQKVNNSNLSGSDNNSTSRNCIYYCWNYETSKLEVADSSTSASNLSVTKMCCQSNNNEFYSVSSGDLITYGKTYQYKMFMNSADILGDSIGEQPYYLTDKYNSDNTTISGSYNTTLSQIDNSITYGDVNNYINNYYNNPNNQVDGQPTYPSTSDIYIYINNYVPESNPSGGGGSDDSGGGSDDDSGGFDWGWIGEIGKFIGSLISALGNALVGVVEGLVDVITSIIEIVPSVFGDFLSVVLGWLPPELQVLVTLSITAMVVFGLIRLIRG